MPSFAQVGNPRAPRCRGAQSSAHPRFAAAAPSATRPPAGEASGDVRHRHHVPGTRPDSGEEGVPGHGTRQGPDPTLCHAACLAEEFRRSSANERSSFTSASSGTGVPRRAGGVFPGGGVYQESGRESIHTGALKALALPPCVEREKPGKEKKAANRMELPCTDNGLKGCNTDCKDGPCPRAGTHPQQGAGEDTRLGSGICGGSTHQAGNSPAHSLERGTREPLQVFEHGGDVSESCFEATAAPAGRQLKRWPAI